MDLFLKYKNCKSISDYFLNILVWWGVGVGGGGVSKSTTRKLPVCVMSVNIFPLLAKLFWSDGFFRNVDRPDIGHSSLWTNWQIGISPEHFIETHF